MSYWIAGAAAVGALMDRKQPLRGAALGAGTALTGGAALGAVGGGAAAGGAAAGGAATAGSAAGAGGLLGTGTAATAGTTATIGGASAAAPVAASGAAPVAAGSTGSFGTQAMGYLDSANKVLKPIGQAANAAGAVQSMFPESQPVTTPAPQFGGGAGSQTFTGLLQDSMNTEQMRAQEEMRRREAQQKLIGLIGGM